MTMLMDSGRLVQAFEAQLGIEQDAEDIDYDASGRMQFTNRVGEEVVDGKGAPIEGARIERKRFAIAVHHRQAGPEAGPAVRAAVGEERGVRVAMSTRRGSATGRGGSPGTCGSSSGASTSTSPTTRA